MTVESDERESFREHWREWLPATWRNDLPWGYYAAMVVLPILGALMLFWSAFELYILSR